MLMRRHLYRVLGLSVLSGAAFLTPATGVHALSGNVPLAPGAVRVERRSAVVSLQLENGRGPASGGGFSLSARPLLGRFGLSATEILAELAPHLSACELRLSEVHEAGAAVHEVYELRFGGYPLANAYLRLHHLGNKLVMLRAALPDFRLPSVAPTAADFLPLADLGFAADEDTQQVVRAVIADFGGLPSPAWEVSRSRAGSGTLETLLVEAQTGAILESREAAFDMATVFNQGPKDGTLVVTELPDLPGTGYLDGRHVVVYAPGEGDPRVQAPDNRFEYLPEDPADTISFDQVQAYHGATRALRWFKDNLGYDLGATQIRLRVNDEIGGSTSAAVYTPPPVGPEVRLGAGGDRLVNLARDTDVVSHELGHHLLYPYLSSSTDDSGILHEGTSDYLAYAINGDPYLGESVVPGKPYLRTAALAADDRYDGLESGVPSHIAGQYWSAVLWRLRGEIGPEFDKLVYASFPYLGPDAGLSDAFLALLNADRDRYPLAAGAAEAGVYGSHKCAILNAGVDRGFAASLDGLDGSSCGLDLAALAEVSRANRNKPVQGTKAGMKISMFGRTCAVVGVGPTSASTAFTLIAIPLLLAPLIVAQGTARQRRRHGS